MPTSLCSADQTLPLAPFLSLLFRIIAQLALEDRSSQLTRDRLVNETTTVISYSM